MLKILPICFFLIFHLNAVELSERETVRLALESNPGLLAQQITPLITSTREKTALAAYEPDMSASAETTRFEGLRGYQENEKLQKQQLTLSLDKEWSTGTSLELSASSTLDDIHGDTVNDTRKSHKVELELTQPLIKGRGRDIGLINVRKSHLNTDISLLQLEGYTMGLIHDVLHAYWDTHYQHARVGMVKVSRDLAKAQEKRTIDLIEAGKMAEIELAAAKAELASREELVVSAQGDYDIQRIRLLAELNPSRSSLGWDSEFKGIQLPQDQADQGLSLEVHIARALKNRPELLQSEHRLSINSLDLIQSRQGLLPKLDLYMRVNRSRFHDRFINGNTDNKSVGKEWETGFSFSYPLGRMAEKATLDRNQYSKLQQELALENLKLSIELDVRLSWIRLKKLREKEKAANLTVVFRTDSLKAESDKFSVGHSTSLNVARAQRDLLTAELSLLKTKVDIIKALVTLAEADGTLLGQYVSLQED